MSQDHARPVFRKCRHAACGCTVQGDTVYCSRHCEEHADSAIASGHGCQCGHTECTRDKPPAAPVGTAS